MYINKQTKMKNYQKIFTVIVLGMLIIPQVTFAAWWNPTSWSIFSFLFHPQPQVETIIPATSSTNMATDVSSSSTAVSNATTTATTTEISIPIVTVPVKKTVKKTAPVPPVQTPQQVQPSGTLCNGTYWKECPAGQNLICPSNGNAYCQSPQQPVQPISQVASSTIASTATTTTNVVDKGTPYKAQDGNWYYPNAYDANGRNLQVIIPGPKVIVNINPSSIEYGGTATISWTANGATSCTLNSSPVLFAPTGSQTTGALTTSTTYSVSCTDKDGTASGSATANVQPWAPPPGVRVLPAWQCSQSTAPCTTQGGGYSCSKDGCGG